MLRRDSTTRPLLITTRRENSIPRMPALDPQNTEVYLERANIYYSQKRYDKTWEDVHKAQELGYRFEPAILEYLRKRSGREK